MSADFWRCESDDVKVNIDHTIQFLFRLRLLQALGGGSRGAWEGEVNSHVLT